MKHTSADSQNESKETTPWPSVLRIARDEFEQSLAVAQLAVELSQLKKAATRIPLEKEKLDPKDFLAEAWELIHSAREQVLRSQTNAEYLAKHGGRDEAMEDVVGRILEASYVPFKKICDANRKKDHTEMIHGVKWKVYRSERGFYDLFQAYWRYIGEQWKAKQIAGYSEAARDTAGWKERGKILFDSWKTNGVPPNTFLALASGYFDFERGVKVITEENRLDRALPSFRRFLKSRFDNEDMAERAMAEYREKRFAPKEPYSLKDEFAEWKRNEKSRNAKLSRQARGKRGRVKSKSDKRLGGRPPHLTEFRMRKSDIRSSRNVNR